MHSYDQTYEKDVIGKAKTSYVPGLDWEDLAQELRITIWKKSPAYLAKNDASERTFIQKVMRNRIIDLARHANRKKRYIDTYHLSLDFLAELELNQINDDNTDNDE